MRRRYKFCGGRERGGAALLLCMMFTSAVMVPLSVLTIRTAGHVRHAQYASLESAALAGAEAALAIAKAQIESGESGSIGFAKTLNAEEALDLESLASPDDVMFQTFPGTPEVHWFTIATHHERLPDGWTAIYAVAHAGPSRRCVEGIFRPKGGGALARVSWREIALGTEQENTDATL